MSFYNMLHGVNPAAFFYLPMLDKHPDEYPRFRDCFLKDGEHPEFDNHIHVYTRTGGGNREGYAEENQEMRSHPNFVADFDDSDDSTYASWVFSIPEKWRPDFDLLRKGELSSVSDDYKKQMVKVFPKLKEKLSKLFKGG